MVCCLQDKDFYCWLSIRNQLKENCIRKIKLLLKTKLYYLSKLQKKTKTIRNSTFIIQSLICIWTYFKLKIIAHVCTLIDILNEAILLFILKLENEKKKINY